MKFACALALVGSFAFSKGQNLIQNSSFEIVDSCPDYLGDIIHVSNWLVPSGHAGTPDYFNVCSFSSLVSVPENFLGYEDAATGDSYIGLILSYYSNYHSREYVYTRFKGSMIKGNRYTISLRYSLADRSHLITDAFGIYLSKDSLSGFKDAGFIDLNPQLKVSDFLDHKEGWVTLKWNYEAEGGERFMTMGNFLDSASTILVPAFSNWDIIGSYIFIDDVKVEGAFTSSEKIVMPNFFSPNGDGANDFFHPLSYAKKLNTVLRVYNRQGLQVFETTDVNQGWGGKCNGNDCVDGVYYWLLQYVDEYREAQIMKGFVTLVR